MPTRSDADGGIDLALCRAALYSALALGFRPPTRETIERLAAPEAAAALADVVRAFESIVGPMRVSQRAAVLAQPDLDVAALAADFRRLFGHTARGEVPAYETEYGDEALFQQPQELGDLAGFLHAFGLVLRPEAHERIDHVSCECELMSFLACKEAYAREHGDDEMLAATVRAAKLFVRDHLGRFAPAFGHRLARVDADGFYGALARLLLALVAADCARLGIAAGSESLALRPDPATCAAPMGCSAASDGVCGADTGA